MMREQPSAEEPQLRARSEIRKDRGQVRAPEVPAEHFAEERAEIGRDGQVAPLVTRLGREPRPPPEDLLPRTPPPITIIAVP